MLYRCQSRWAIYERPRCTRESQVPWHSIDGKPYERATPAEVCSMAAAWKVFFIESERCMLDTLRMANRSPTPPNDFLGPFDDKWGPRGRRFRSILGPLGGPGRN